MTLNFALVNRMALANAIPFLEEVLPGGRVVGSEYVVRNPLREDNEPGSFKINWQSGYWCDFALGEGGSDLISLYAWVKGVSQGEARSAIADHFWMSLGLAPFVRARPIVPTWPRVITPVPTNVQSLAPRNHEVGRWDYRDADGRLLMVVVRFQDPAKGKAFVPYTYWEMSPGAFAWKAKALPTPRPLYGLDRLAKRPNARVLVVEGAGAADAAERLYPDYVAVTSGSATSAGSADWSALCGRDVYLVPDADMAGLGYVDEVARRLVPIAKFINILSLPAAIWGWVKPGNVEPGGWDFADPVPEGVDLRGLLDSALCWEEKTDGDA